MNQSDHSAYNAAIEHAAYYNHPRPGIIHIQGADQIDFLQRQTTNDVRKLNSDNTILSVLTSPTARILDVLSLLIPAPSLVNNPDQPGVLILTLPGYGSSTYQYLKRRIFFMDKVTLVDLSEKFFHIHMIGPSAGDILMGLGFTLPPAQFQLTWGRLDDAPLAAIGGSQGTLSSYQLIGLRSIEEEVINAIRILGVPLLPIQAYETIRIETGQPGPGTELVENYTPLEAGLAEAVSATKGCYTGQEVLARQVTYDKVTQSLCGLRLSTAHDPGVTLKHGDLPVGRLTSSTVSPRFGPIGLGIVKHPYHMPGTVLVADGTSLTVTSLPFLL